MNASIWQCKYELCTTKYVNQVLINLHWTKICPNRSLWKVINTFLKSKQNCTKGKKFNFFVVRRFVSARLQLSITSGHPEKLELRIGRASLKIIYNYLEKYACSDSELQENIVLLKFSHMTYEHVWTIWKTSFCVDFSI